MPSSFSQLVNYKIWQIFTMDNDNLLKFRLGRLGLIRCAAYSVYLALPQTLDL